MAANFNHTKYRALQQGNKVESGLYSEETSDNKQLINSSLN